MLEGRLIEHCAPTLAGIKVGGLFSYHLKNSSAVQEEIDNANKKLNEKGVYVEILADFEDYVLIYIYRKNQLNTLLGKGEVRRLLAKFGYSDGDLNSSLAHLKERLKNSKGFPHEIGVFLGYPLTDVKGFIDNRGKNCMCCGLWKVYGDRYEAEKMFQKIKKCTEIYIRLFEAGRSITKMTVAA